MPWFSAAAVQALVPCQRRYARALTGNREAAGDLTQDTLERARAKRELSQAGNSLRVWLFTVMHGVFVNRLRRWRPTESLDALDFEGGEQRDAAASAEIASAGRDLRRVLASLPDEQRQVVPLLGLEQLSCSETAEVLGMPIGTVMSRQARGRERLRQLLDDETPTGRGCGG
jgi:RNA polymerase sigma-70 factor (ECF subfamily)